jgi:hypothetical protein
LRKQQDSGISQLSSKVEKDYILNNYTLPTQGQAQNHLTLMPQNNQNTQYNSNNTNFNQNKLEDVLKQMKFLSDKQLFLIDSIEKIQEHSKKENEALQGRITHLEGQVDYLMDFIKNIKPQPQISQKGENETKVEKEENLNIESLENNQYDNQDSSHHNNQIHNAYSSNVMPTASFNTFTYESNTIYKDDFDSFGGNLNPSQSARTLVNNYSRKGNSNVWNEILQELKVKYLKKIKLCIFKKMFLE